LRPSGHTTAKTAAAVITAKMSQSTIDSKCHISSRSKRTLKLDGPALPARPSHHSDLAA
jgi:hypothetical protein